MIYTVIGIYDDGRVYAQHVEAEDPHAAMAFAANDLSHLADDVEFVGAIEGEHHVYAPCEDSGCAAMAVDCRGDD